MKYKFYYKSPNWNPKDEWIEITEVEFHSSLYQHVKQVTPIIKILLKKESIELNEYHYKLVCF